MEASTEVLQPLVEGDYLTNGKRLVMVLGPGPDDSGGATYWVEDATMELGAEPLDGEAPEGVFRLPERVVQAGLWRRVERG